MERVDLLISWDTWWTIVAAIVVGCGIYDLILWSFETVAKGAPPLLQDLARQASRWGRRVVSYRPEFLRVRAWAAAIWVRVLDRDVEEYAAKIVVADPPERTPVARWCLNEASRTLHLAECRWSGACAPWYWASTFEEARYWAGRQGLKVGCSCKPVGDLAAVRG